MQQVAVFGVAFGQRLEFFVYFARKVLLIPSIDSCMYASLNSLSYGYSLRTETTSYRSELTK